ESDFYVLDLNGDGKDDIIDFYSKLSVCLTGINYDENCVLNGSPGFVKYISKGAGVLSLYGVQKISDNLTGKEIRVDFADIDGDGMKDATLMVNPSKWTETPSFNGAIYKNYANTQRYRVYNISNGMNQAVGFTYTSLAAANSTLYTKGKSSQFPVIDIQPAQFVVASLISHAGYKNGSNYVYSVTDFSYKGARSHMQGRGYLGFDTLVSVNSLSGIKTESVYGINTPYYFRYPVVTNSYVSNVATGIKTTNFVTQGRGTSGYYSYPASSTSTDLLSNTTVAHKYKFDNYGNMTSDTALIGSDAVVATNNTYAIVGDSAVPNKLSTTKTSSQYTGRAAFVTYKTFGYDAKGNLITTVDFADQAKPITSAYTLNNYGMPESTTVSAPGVTPRTSRTNYDTKYRLPVRSINALGYKSARTFNYALGVPLADSLPNGLQTTYAYDEFGRLKSTTVPQ
ncbi:MAG TPA: toxin TcdB middle/N-terminal domain-containing protein, partial [Bacteroidales bacterium]|nr:toxin TcdB middle/N-terminal domain-containing protein [Bacteroidales bacterium]